MFQLNHVFVDQVTPPSWFESLQETISMLNFPTVLSFFQTAHYVDTSLKLVSGGQANRFLSKVSILSIVNLPYSLYEIFSESQSFFAASLNGKFDISLKIISKLSTIGYATWAFLGEMKGRVIPVKALKWLPVLGIVSSIFEGIAMISDIKGLIRTHQLALELENQASLFKNIHDYTLEDFEKGMGFLEKKYNEENSFITDHFGAHEVLIVHKLFNVLTIAKTQLNGSKEDILSAKKMMHRTLNTLKERITFKKWTHALSLLISTIDLIAIGILFSPISPLAKIFFALSGLLYCGDLVFEHLKDRKFRQILDSLGST